MRILGEWIRRLHYLIHRRKHEEDLRREMQIHRELMEKPRNFGNTLRLREVSRDVWGWNWLDDVFKDLSYGVRQLRKTLGWTTLAVLTLAIAIGSLGWFSGSMKAALFADLPVANPGELQQIVWNLRSASDLASRGNSNFSYPVYRYVQAHTTSFSSVACWSTAFLLTLRGSDDLTEVSAQFVSGNFFATTGVETILGRPISIEDDAATASPVGVLSYGVWQRLFGGDDGVIGRTVALNGSPFVVIGVLANKEFQRTPRERWDADVILPVSSYSPTLVRARDTSNADATCRVVGRIPPQISLSRARQESEGLIRQAFQAAPLMRQGQRIDGTGAFVGLRGLRTVDQIDSMAGAPALLFLMMASLLAIVCSNIAGMMLARGAVRRSEVATRLALGATRRRIIRQLLTESLLLAGIGGALGLVLCYAAGKFSPWSFALDFSVLAITAVLSGLTALIFGLAPALTATRLDLNSVMKLSSPGDLGRTFRSGKVLIAVQVTLSLLLLVAAGLQVHSLLGMMVPDEFEPEHVLTIQASPRTAGYTAERIRVYFEEAVHRLEGVPGVSSATVSSGNGGFTLISTGSENPDVRVVGDYVGPRFFETMRIPVLVGRDTAWTDRKEAPPVVVVNETFARTLFPNTDPLGQVVRLRGGRAEIVGVVANSNNSVGDAYAFGQLAQPAIYLPFQQHDGSGSMILSARLNTDASALTAASRRAVQDLDADVVVNPPATQADHRNINIRERRLLVVGLVCAGSIALIEVALGVYGMLSFFVGTRTSEIGLRIALGARRVDVFRMVLRQSLTPAAAGTLLGLAGSPALVRVLDNGGFLVGIIRLRDELAIVGVALLILCIGLAAALAPARRASRANPMQALRHE